MADTQSFYCRQACGPDTYQPSALVRSPIRNVDADRAEWRNELVGHATVTGTCQLPLLLSHPQPPVFLRSDLEAGPTAQIRAPDANEFKPVLLERRGFAQLPYSTVIASIISSSLSSVTTQATKRPNIWPLQCADEAGYSYC